MSFGSEPRWSRSARRLTAGAFAVAWSVVAVLALSELFLVGFAERRAVHGLEENATDVSVRIEARPAAKLLVKRADDVVVRIGTLRVRKQSGDGGGGLGDLLARTGASTRVDVRIATVVSTRVTMHDVRLVKRDDRLTATATVTRKAAAAALPRNIRLSARAGSGAFGLTAKVSALGRSVRARAKVMADDGRLVVAPQLSGVTIVALTLFSDERVSVDSIRATTRNGRYRFEAEGHLT